MVTYKFGLCLTTPYLFFTIPQKSVSLWLKALLIMEAKQVHQGRATKRIREILGIKQEELAIGLGITQQAVSLLEAKEVIDPKMLEDVAKVLKVPIDAITRFNEDATISVIANTFTDFKDNAIASAMNYYPTFNPIDKVIELLERMLKEKDEIIAELKEGKKK